MKVKYQDTIYFVIDETEKFFLGRRETPLFLDIDPETCMPYSVDKDVWIRKTECEIIK